MSAQDAPVGQPPAGLLAPEEVCDQFVAKCKEGAEKYLALTLPAERKHLNAELSAHFVSTILEGGMASQEAAAVAGLELLLLLTDTERLALGIDVVARAGAMAAVLQCLVEQKGSVRVPRLACQVCKHRNATCVARWMNERAESYLWWSRRPCYVDFATLSARILEPWPVAFRRSLMSWVGG